VRGVAARIAALEANRQPASRAGCVFAWNDQTNEEAIAARYGDGSRPQTIHVLRWKDPTDADEALRHCAAMSDAGLPKASAEECRAWIADALSEGS
jgi:hypothetical protein